MKKRLIVLALAVLALLMVVPLLGSAVRFAVVIAVCYLVSFGISDLLVPFAASALALPLSQEWVTRIAMLVAQVIFTGMNYIGQRLWAFKD